MSSFRFVILLILGIIFLNETLFFPWISNQSSIYYRLFERLTQVVSAVFVFAGCGYFWTFFYWDVFRLWMRCPTWKEVPMLPPGPMGLPFLGNLLSLDPKTPYQTLSSMVSFLENQIRREKRLKSNSAGKTTKIKFAGEND